MSILFQDGFDSGIHKWTSNAGTLVYATGNGVYGTGSVMFPAGANDIANTARKVFKTSTDVDTSNPLIRCSFWLRTNTAITANSTILEIGDQSVLQNVNTRFFLTTLGQIQVYRTGQNTTPLPANTVTAYPRIDDGNWHHVEIEAKFAPDSTGRVVIYVDTANVYYYAGNTWPTGGGAAGLLRRNDYIQIGNVKPTAQTFFDDIMVWDDSGSTLTGLQGPMRIYTMRPAGDTVQADSTPSTGSDRFAMIDEEGNPNNDTDYTVLPVLGKDLYTLTSLPTTPGAIGAIKSATITINFNSSIPGRANVRPIASVNGISVFGNTTNVISRTYVTPQIQYDVSRDFGNSNVSWTASSINGLTIGVENVG